MVSFSTREAAKRLGLSPSGLSKHLRLGKLPSPATVKTGTGQVHAWTEQDIENARQLLPKIANGRKTRYKKQQSAGVKPKKKQTRKK